MRRALACCHAVLLACVPFAAIHAAPLPYQSLDQHLGVASCASSLCHGSVTPNAHYDVLLNEYITWSHQDAHAKAFLALTSERGRSIAAKLGLPSAEGAKVCLDCHSDNVAAAQRGGKFALTDGVGCEACHGGAERWIASHATAKATYKDDVGKGMYPSANLAERATLCESCHLGNADKPATHNMMGAGHPRLSFELDTYLALEPPHYTIDANYRQRKSTFSHTQTWAEGQLRRRCVPRTRPVQLQFLSRLVDAASRMAQAHDDAAHVSRQRAAQRCVLAHELVDRTCA
jgi:hypothetical protein